MLHQKLLLLSMSKKKYNDYFVLKSYCKLMYDDYCELLSNYVIVVSLIRGRGIKNNYCGLPYWRS